MHLRVTCCLSIGFVAVFMGGWGPRGHIAANRAAVQAIPADGPVFLKNYAEWIAQTGPLPDSWRGASEPYSKLFEDPNHGWFEEQFAFMKEIPRSRYEFVLALYDEYLRIRTSDPERAKRTNVRWTGTLPYAAMENYDRMKAAMRSWRQMTAAKQDTKFIEQDIAFYMGWLGHYTADGAQPLHDTIHHDGWQGPNPKHYTTDPRIHGRFESSFVELIGLSDADLSPLMTKTRVLDDPFAATLRHLDDAATHVEEIYVLDSRGAFADAGDAEARRLVTSQLAKAASLLRDLTYTAWVQSGEPVQRLPNPIDPANPLYNPATGTAPPEAALQTGPSRTPLQMNAPVQDKNFYLLSLMERTTDAKSAIESDVALAAMARSKKDSLARAAKSCAVELACYANALKWTDGEIAAASAALRAIYKTSDAAKRMVDQSLRSSGVLIRYENKPGDEIFAQGWAEAARGMNHAIDVYGTGLAPRYPSIDSISWDLKTDVYGRLVQTIATVLEDDEGSMTLFFEPSLRFALALMDANHRDEAGRLEPLELGENAAAVRHAKTVAWDRFPYSVIVVPGSGPERDSWSFSPYGKLRVELAAKRFREGKAPFILVSGGYVHPSQTPWCEALEMKKSLMKDFGIPEEAILVDPHARHTTTNLRNAAREIYRYGLPWEKKALITSDQAQSKSIEDPAFAARCVREMGYEPVRLVGRVSAFDLEFLPRIESLEMDAMDPLDP